MMPITPRTIVHIIKWEPMKAGVGVGVRLSIFGAGSRADRSAPEAASNNNSSLRRGDMKARLIPSNGWHLRPATKLVTSFLLVVGLVAGCGGSGGDGGTMTPAPAPVPTPTPTPPPVDPAALYAIQATEGPSTYVAGSTKETIYKALGQARGTMYGYMHQSAALDTAAQGHAAYVAATLQTGHTQIPATPGFTGATLADRIRVAGYSGTASEIVGGVNVFTGKAEDFVPGMLSTLYHGEEALSTWRDIGVGVARDVTNTQDIVVLVFGIKSGAAGQLPAAETTKIYPADGQEGIFPTFYIAGEVPRPLPELLTAGHPVFFSVANVAEANTAAASITVQSATLKDVSGNLVPTLLVTAPGTVVDATLTSTHRQDALIDVKNVYLVPAAPLVPQATYTASAQVKTLIATYSKTWTFKTGDQK